MNFQLPCLASGELWILLGALLLLWIIPVLVFWVFNIVICLLLHGCFRRIPRRHRWMEPGFVWLLLIPCFFLIWNFFVFPRLSRSYQAYFRSVGRTHVGDCGRSIGMAYCICSVCFLIPVKFLSTALGLTALVLLILYLVKVLELKNQIPLGGGVRE